MQVDFTDSRDSLHLPRLLTGLQKCLQVHDLPLRELLVDAGYANGWIRPARPVPVSAPVPLPTAEPVPPARPEVLVLALLAAAA